MTKIVNFFKKIWPTKRKWMQLYFALLFNANIKGFINIKGMHNGQIYKGDTKNVCMPGLNCYSCPGAVTACPLGSLQNAIGDHGALFYVCGILVLYGILFGRMICGWLCPFGWIQELLHKIKTPKVRKSPITRILSYFKYVVLVFFCVIIPLMYASPGFCKFICPAGTLEGGVGLLSNPVNEGEMARLGPLFTWKFLLMVSVVIGCIFIFRLFCRFLCPLGALYALFNRISVFGIKLNRDKCVDCNRCISHCKMDIRHVGDTECIQCGECISVCPTDAIQWKGPKILLPKNVISKDDTVEVVETKKKKQRITRIIATVVLLAILIGTGIYHWNKSAVPPPAPPPQQQSNSNSDSNNGIQAPYGTQIGNRCYGYPLKIMDANGQTDKTIDPATTGKVTVINFWATWCDPCKAELPDFERVAQEYSDNVTVVAVHGLASETGPSYLAEHFPDPAIVFTYDYGTPEYSYHYLLGGTGSYPYTLILDKNGVITKTFSDKVHYDELKAAVEEALGK